MYQAKACFPKVKKIAAINAPAAECLMLTFLFWHDHINEREDKPSRKKWHKAEEF